LDADVDRGKNISEGIKTSVKESISNYELRQHKLRSEKDGSKFLKNRRKQKKLLLLHIPG
jgi:hypothetical protein